MRPSNSQFLTNGISGSASFVSSAVYTDCIVRASFQITVASGSCVGTFQIQGSNDQSFGVPANQFNPTNWNSIGSSATITCSSTATNNTFLIPAQELAYEYLRIKYTDGSGAAAIGLVNARVKAIGL